MSKEKLKLFFEINWIKFIKLNFFTRRIKRNKGYIVPFFKTRIVIDKSSELIINNGNLLIGQHSDLAVKRFTCLTIINNSKMVCENRFGVGQGAYIHVNFGGLLTLRGGALGNDSRIGCELLINIDQGFLSGREINIRDNDSHSIEKSDGTFNEPKGISIGKHVWICDKCTILKGAKINNNVVVGTGSIICGLVESDNIVVNKHQIQTYRIKTWTK